MSGFSSALLPRTGDIIDGKYSLERLLGQGGMGAVYAARHLKLGHSVAIKVMLADAGNQEAARRFLNEGRAAANIQNDHVVRVFDVDEEHGYAYMVLELLEGEDLAQVLEERVRLPSPLAVSYVLQALEGVRQAHAQGIVHRDLKPANLFLAARPDGSKVVKVLDFGISKANNASGLGAAPGALTSTKAMLGSPLYMSPEQLRSSKSVDARADIWAVGIILFELISGTLPFSGENLGELFAAILETDAPNLQAVQPDTPPGLAAVVAHCLQRRPEHRFQTVAELERELAPFAEGARAPSVPMAPTAMLAGATTSPTPWHDPAQNPPQHPAPEAPPLTGSTVLLGAHAPQTYAPAAAQAISAQATSSSALPPQRQTGSTWQNTGAGIPAKGSNTGLIVGLVCALLALGALSLAAFVKLRGKPDVTTGAGAASVASVASEVPPATAVPASASAAPTVAATSSPGVASASSAAETASAEPPKTAIGAAAKGPRHRASPSPSPAPSPAVNPSPTAAVTVAKEPPRPEVPKPAPTPARTAPAATGVLQNGR